jgi:hypothetical protein
MARFYGIIIKIFFGDHPPPHFHAVYGEHLGVFSIETQNSSRAICPSALEGS